MLRRACGLALLLAGCGATPVDPAPAERPMLGLMTALPLLWGEAGIDELLSGGGERSPAVISIDRRFRVEPVDAVTPEALARFDLLLIAQPAVPSPHELVAVDGWVRAGGRALILADPLLAWESRYGLGDPRRPPAVQPLGRLLAHWGVAIDPPTATGRETIMVGEQALATVTPGRLRRLGGDCSLAGALARCRIGRGEVLIVPDADLIDATSAGAALDDNVAAIIDLMSQLSAANRQAADSG